MEGAQKQITKHQYPIVPKLVPMQESEFIDLYECYLKHYELLPWKPMEPQGVLFRGKVLIISSSY